MAIQSIDAVGSSDSFVSGYFGILDLAEDMVGSYLSELVDHIETARQDAERSVQSQAANLPGWSDISSTIKVTVQNGDIEVTSTSPTDVVNDLEYGTPDQAPIPLLRMSAPSVREDINEYVKTESRKDVPLA